MRTRIDRAIWVVAAAVVLTGAAALPQEATDRPAPSVPEKVALKHGRYEAVFRRVSGFELDYLRTADDVYLPVSTSMEIRTTPRGAAGAPSAFRRVHATEDRLDVEYERDGFLHRHTFAWEGDALAVRRRVISLRPVEVEGAAMNQVLFELPFNRLVREHGAGSVEGRLPASGWTQVTGNWLAVDYGEDTGGVALVLPRREKYSTTLPGRRFSASDAWRISFGEHTPAGITVEHEIWLIPLEPGPLAERAIEATRAVCARLAEQKDPVLAYFAHKHVAPGDHGRVVARTDTLSLWQADMSDTVPETSAVPRLSADRVTLALARGETEPIHLVLSSVEPLENVSVACSALTGDAGVLAAEQARVRYAAYARIRPTTQEERDKTSKPAQMNFVVVVDDGDKYLVNDRFYGGSAEAVGAVEDVLYDRESVDLKPGRNQPVWVTLTAPPDARPGRYRGEIQVRAGDRVLCRTPIEVTVWSFTLPQVASLRTWYQVFPHLLFSDQFPRLKGHWQDYYRNLVAHKASGFGLIPAEPKLSYADGKVTVDWTEFDAVASFLFDELGLRCGKLPHGKVGGAGNTLPFIGLPAKTPEYEAALADYMQQAHDHLAARGWLEKLDCYIWDEPHADEFEVILRAARIIRKAFPHMRIFSASSYHPAPLVGVLNAWCPPISRWKTPAGEFTAERIAEDRARGDMHWWYNLLNDALGNPVVAHRALLWATWREGLQGYFMWTINYWGLPDEPFVQRHTLGSAFYVYPGLNGPVDSLRWEQTRDGLEEYDYLVMLEKAIARPDVPAATAEKGRALLARVRGLFPDPRALTGVNPRELAEIRIAIGTLLDELEGPRK